MDDNQRCALKFDKIITVIKSLITMKYCPNINFSNAAIVHCLDNYTLLNPVVFYEKYPSKYLIHDVCIWPTMIKYFMNISNQIWIY